MMAKSKKIYTLQEAIPFGMAKPQAHASRRHGRNVALLERCYQAWNNLENVRKTRDRVIDYCYGDQWGEIVEYKGGTYTERQLLYRRGSVPLTNNLMISILNSLVGLYSKQGAEPVCFARTQDSQWLSDLMSATMQSNWQDTHMGDLLKHAFEEYLCSGVAFMRESYEERDQLFDAYTDSYDLPFVFWEGGNDARHNDLDLVGVLHDISPDELFFRFAKPEYGLTKADLEEFYHVDSSHIFRHTSGVQYNDRNKDSYITFSSPAELGKVRVIEVWYRDTKERYQCYDPIATNSDEAYFRCEPRDIKGMVDDINAQRRTLYEEEGVPEEERAYIQKRLIVDLYWQYCYMTPDGDVLCEGETPYDFKSHPFTLKLYPYTNGEIHPYMGNIIDQQRLINRQIVMHDMATRSAAKGVTLVPKENLPDGMSPQDFADEFTSYDGIIFYDTNKVNPDLRPEIITSNATQIGTTELLQLEISLINQISNVQGALQGKTPTAGTSASRYALETQNASTAVYSPFFDFTSLAEMVAHKKCSIIKQYYPDGKLILNNNNRDIQVYDRMSVQDVMFKISVKEAGASAAYQTQANDMMEKLLQMGRISTEQYLQNVNLPFADELLRDVQSEQARQQAVAQLQQQVNEQGGADMQQVAQAQQQLNPQQQ